MERLSGRKACGRSGFIDALGIAHTVALVVALAALVMGCSGDGGAAGSGGVSGPGAGGGAAAGVAGSGSTPAAGGAGSPGGLGGRAAGSGGVAGHVGAGSAGQTGAGGAGGGAGAAGGGGGAGALPVTLCGFPMPNAVATGLPTPASYDISHPGLVVDKVTGLTWERDPNGHTAELGCTVDGSGALFCPFRYAAMYCEGNRLGGFSDWRLPTILELVSLVDYAAQYPAIDLATFPNTPYEPAWSATRGAGNALDVAWSVGFTDGYLRQTFIDQPQRVRCVRGGASAAPQVRCYQSNARFQLDSTTATDSATGLIWQKGKAATATGLADATAQCAALGNGARVPSINELLTLVDFTRGQSSGALIDTTVFSQPDTFTWSSTVALTQYMSQWTLSFEDGAMAAAGFTNGIGEVRCVR